MKVKVTEKKVMITEISEVYEGEFGINRCDFTLPKSFEGLAVTAIFNGIPVPLTDGKCIIPSLGNGNCILGVYAYRKNGEEMELMYSPKPTMFFVGKGSFCKDFNEENLPEVFDYETYCQMLQGYWRELLESNSLPEYTEDATRYQYYSAKAFNEMLLSVHEEFNKAITNSDAELQDIRIGYEGTSYETAGEAVRSQLKAVNNNFETIYGKNLYNEKNNEHFVIMLPDGKKYPNYSSYILSDYIPVTPGRTIFASYTRESDNNHIKASMRYITAFNSDFQVIADAGSDANSNQYTVPEGVSFIRVSIHSTYWNELQLAYDKTQTSYEQFTEKTVLKKAKFPDITEDKIKENAVTEEKIAENAVTEGKIAKYYYCSLPEKIHITVGQTAKIYFDNLCSLPGMSIRFKPVASLTSKYLKDHFEITAASAGSYIVYWYIYDNNYQRVQNGELTVIATEMNLTDTTVLVLGDSTVNAGKVTQTMLDVFNGNGKNLTLLGTRGTAPNRHEGRGGWKVDSYCNNESLGTYTNAFYNPVSKDFDFSYYMKNQGYEGVDYVVIQLGINDVFAFTFEDYNSSGILSNFENMINSILAYDHNIKIILNVTIPPNSNVDIFGNAYGAAQIAFVYRANVIRFANELMARFKNNPDITLCSTNCVIDTATQINDGVHPTNEGYAVLGNQVINTLNYLLNI